MSASPVIETERLILRRPEGRDAEGAVAFYLSDRAKHVGRTESRNIAWLMFAAEIGHWEIRRWGMFAVEEKATGCCVGLAGPFFPDGWPERELGWLVWPEAEGRGIAHEAALAARAHAFGALGWKTAVSYIEPDNHRSIRLAERLGAVRDDDAARIDPDDLVYRHPRPEAA